MKHWNKITNTLRYLAASLVVACVIGVLTACVNIMGSGVLLIPPGGLPHRESKTLNVRADSNEVYLEWTKNTYAVSYTVLRDGKPIYETSVRWYLDTSVSASTRYCYRIDVVESDVVTPSNTACITTPATGGWEFETIDDGNNTALALDSSNQAHVSYRRSKGIMLATKIGVSWQRSVVDSSAGKTGDTNLVVDMVNNNHVSYIDDINNRLMYASNSTNTGVWQTQTVDTTVLGVNALGVDSTGNAHIVYNNAVTDLGVVSYATNSSGSWQTERIVEFSNESIRDADILVDAAGAVHLVFTSEFAFESIGCSVNYMTKKSGAWQRQVVDDNKLCGVAMATDTAGNIHVVYSGWIENTGFVLIHAYNNGGAWQFEEIESQPARTYPSELDLAIDGANRLHITYRDDNNNIKYATRVNGMWEFTLLDSDRNGYYGDPSIVVDPMGHVTVVYIDQSRGTITLVTGP